MVLALCLRLLAVTRGTDLHVVIAPYSVALAGCVVEPDLIVAPASDFTERDIHVPPLLVVEVRSPSTARLDAVSKLDLYQEAGVPHYWLVDPVAPAIEVLALRDGRYQRVGNPRGDERLSMGEPFSITLCPAELAR